MGCDGESLEALAVMASFTNSLKTEWLPDGKHWRVTESYRFHSGKEGSALFVEVPRGFVTDLASIPLVLRWLVPKVGKDSAASVVHDVLYRSGMMTSGIVVDGVEHTSQSAISRGMADSVYHQALKALRVGRLRRKALYHAVSIFGWITWNYYRKKDMGISTETTV